MVMIFSSKKALNFLQRHGLVFTVRCKKRKMKNAEQKDWITDKRGGKKIVDVVIEFWDEIDRDNLEYVLQRYVDRSGFLTVSEWIGEIKRLNRGKLPKKLYLYRVLLLHSS